MENAENSSGVSSSYGVSSSHGVYSSRGVSSSDGVSNSLFVSKVKRSALLFNKEVTEERISEVKLKYDSLANGWFPKFNNAFKLYDENGKDWSKVDASKVTSYDKRMAYADMPKDLIEYLVSLQEFDAQVFKDVTDIDVSNFQKVEVILDGKTLLIDRGCVEKIMKILKGE